MSQNISPRFNYTKKSIEGMQVPGPGAYSINPQKSPIHNDASPPFRAISRDKGSLFGKIVSKAGIGPGPGSYNNDVSTIVKKTFNTNLAK